MGSEDVFEISLGDAEWDHQHREFHALFRRLEEIEKQIMQNHLQGGRDGDALAIAFGDVLGETLAAMIQHSLWEEKLMKTLPKDAETVALCDAHRHDHYQTATRISLLVGNLQEQGLQASITNFGRIMMEWLVGHIKQHDLPLEARLLALGWTPVPDGKERLHTA